MLQRWTAEVIDDNTREQFASMEPELAKAWMSEEIEERYPCETLMGELEAHDLLEQGDWVREAPDGATLRICYDLVDPETLPEVFEGGLHALKEENGHG